MLTLVALWIVLSVAGVGVGFALLGLVRATPSGRIADEIFFAWWMGVAALAWASFAIVNIAPLRSATPWLAVALLIIASWGLWRSRNRWRALRPPGWIGFVVLALLLAERSVAVGNLEDTGGYHWSIIQWYEAFGIPAGLGLFQWRLATHSAWLAFTALLDIGVLESRVATVANGLAFLVCLWFAAVCALRWIRGCATFADRFVVAAFAFLLQLIAKWEMRLSPSPDVPVLLLTVVICWKLLADACEKRHSGGNIYAVAILSVVAVTIKLNALPLALVCVVLCWMQPDVALRMRIIGTASLGVIAAPLVIASWTSTGCLLFPVSLGCIDAPSAVGAAAARQYAAIIRATARNDIGPSLVVSLIALAYLWWLRRELPRHALAGPIAIALAGIAFTALVAPTTRFAIGYLTILPALAIAHAAGDARYPSGVSPRTLSALRASVAVVLVSAIAIPLYKEFVYSSLRIRQFDTWADRKRGDIAINAPNPEWWLIPNRIAYQGRYETARAVDFDYAVSPQMTCWNHAQPCASNPPLATLPDIRLRDPSRGLAGGFVRAR
ncbi:MAG TPA: hypothetical protein VGL25_08600 [Casimicrobiaceae bacterium]